MRKFGLLACAVLASCETTSGLTGGDDGGVPANGCASGQKVCDGTCVEIGDPRYGCTETGCTPCAAPDGTSVRCDPGRCRVSSCAEGFDDCDGDPSNGCETDLTKPTSCGSCTRNCPPDAKFCDNARCSFACSPGTTDCGGSCVDLTSAAQHCGACNKACPSTPNGQATCADSQCGIKCNAGYGDCDGNPSTCEALTPYYADADLDGFGAGPAVGSACVVPSGHSATNDDCNDSNKNVRPDQTTFFTVGYVNASGVTSYDYDCNGVEQNEGGKVLGGVCTTSCALGYEKVQPSRGPGKNDYCGSSRAVIFCSSTSSSDGGAISCSTSTSASTMGCR